jgi:predicted MFS family arabinose efflux permease
MSMVEIGARIDNPLRPIGAFDRDWWTLVACSIGLVFSIATVTIYSFGIFIRPLAKDFGWTRGQTSAAIAVGQYALALSAPVWGLLVDRFGPRKIVVPSAVALAAALASLSLLTPHLWHLYVAYALLPIVGGGSSAVGYAAVLVRRFDRRLGLALGVTLMGVGLGATIIPPLAQSLVASLGWRHAYMVLGGITLLISLPASLVATRNTGGPSTNRTAGSLGSVLPFLRTRAFVLTSSALVLLAIANLGTLSHLVPMMIDRGFTPAAAARVAGFAGLSAITSRSVIGLLLDRTHAPRLLGCIAMIAALALLLLVYGNGNFFTYAAVILLGTVIGAEVDFVAYLVRRYFGAASFGRLYGIAFSLYVIGSGTGPLLLGLSFDRFHGYKPGLLGFVGVTIAAGALTFLMPRYESPREAIKAT